MITKNIVSGKVYKTAAGDDVIVVSTPKENILGKFICIVDNEITTLEESEILEE